MAIVYEKLLNLAIPTIEQTYAPKDAMLYALGVGLGLDPMDRGQLDFVFEKNLKVLSTFAVVLAHPGLWVRDLDTGIDALATYGVAGHAILKTVCDYDPTRLKALAGRFTAPVYPGETFRTEIWIDGGVASFRTTALERNVVAISNGRAEFG
ncbi:MAG: MaoC/PaaZ C-terminal domain-containing protein [Roseiarcus sp.]